MRLEITLAGEVTVGTDGRGAPHVVTGPPRVVLAALAVEGPTSVPRDRLADILWPDGLPRTWASALRTHVSRVRAVVAGALGAAGETVTAGGAGYQLVLPEGVTVAVDVDEAEAEVLGARRSLAGDPAAALAMATAAAGRLRGPVLAGHDGPWADELRARVGDLVVGALEVASSAAAATGDGAAAIAWAEEAVQRAPLRESAHRSLMAALGASGNRAEALRAYQRLRRLLADELGVDPSPETDASYLDLLGPAPPRPPARAGGGAPAGMPPGGGTAAVPFVGRDAELAALAEAWHEAVGGARQLVMVSGEAGIGKSRLAAEAALRVSREGGRVLFGRCDEEAIVPYQPVVEALDGLVAATPPGEPAAMAGASRAELAAVLPSLDAPRPPGPPDRARLFGAVTDLVVAAARERPLLLVLDDLQWADDDTALLVRHLLRRADDAALLVVAVCRDHDLAPGDALAGVVHALAREGWVRRLRLGGLAEADVRALLTHLQPDRDHAGAARRLAAETAGNPFLLTELARAPSAVVDGDPGTGAAAAIPPSVHELVSTRLARLGTATVELLRAGAVAGARFDLDIAGHAAGLDDDALLDAADAALASGLVVEETADRYRFPHDIVRRTLLAQLSGARRRWLHGRTADAIERLRAAATDDHVAALAHHSSAGADPAGDARAVRWARRASAQAARRSAPAEAVRLCRQALAHLPPGEGRLGAEVTTELGIALLAAGDQGGGRTLVAGGDLARRHGSPEVLRRAAIALADAAGGDPDLQAAARDLVAHALAAAPAPDGSLAPAGTRPDGGEAAVARARLLVRQLRLGGSPASLPAAPGAPQALRDRIASLADPRDAGERRELAAELAVLAEAAGDPALAQAAAHERAMAAATLGDAGATEAALATVADLVAAGGDPGGRALLAERAVAELASDGRLDQARAALDAAVAAVEAHRGREGPDGADAVAGRHRAVIDWLAGRGPAPALHRPIPTGPEQLHALGVAALAAGDRGDAAALEDVRRRLAPYADMVCGMGYRTFVGAVRFHLGRLAAVAGEWADAERHLLVALRLHSAWGARPWVALTQAGLADVLDARGRPSDREWVAGLRAEADWLGRSLGLRPVTRFLPGDVRP